MNEIKCPKCGTLFQIDESEYDRVVKQIRDKEFEKEIKIREEQYKKDKENAVELAIANIEKELTQKLNKKDLEINELKSNIKSVEDATKNKLEKEYQKNLNESALEIASLKNQIKLQESKNELKIQHQCFLIIL